MRPNRPAYRSLPLVAVVAAGYFLLGRAAAHFGSSHEQISAFWPAAGLATVAAIKGGRRTLVGTLVGAFFSAWCDHPWLGAAGHALGAVTSAWVGAEIFCRVQVDGEWLNRQRDTVAFLVVAAVAPLSALLVGGSILVGMGYLPSTEAPATALTWWLGDALGILAVGPACLTISNWVMSRERVAWGKLALGFLLAGLFAAVLWVMVATPGAWNLVFMLLLLPALVYLLLGEKAVTFTPTVVVSALVLVERFSGWSLIPGQADDNFLLLGVFLVLFCLVSLLIASFERRPLLGWSGMILLAGFCLSNWVFTKMEQERRMLNEQHVASLIDDAQHNLQDQIRTFLDTLRGGGSMLSVTSAPLSQAQWHDYVSSLRLFDEYPGIHGAGVIYPVAAESLAAFQVDQASARRPALRIHPVDQGQGRTTGGLHYVISLIEPLDSNRESLGLDLASEPKRREAADLARDTGLPQITRPIRLVQDQRGRLGFELMVPVYAAGQATATLEQRRAAFQCWVYSPFVFEEFIFSGLGPERREFSCSLYEGDTTAPSARIYANAAAPGTFERIVPLQLAQQRFTLVISILPGAAKLEPFAAFWAAGGLALGIVLLAGLIQNLQSFAPRANQVAEGRTHDLSLANQQLVAYNESLLAANRLIRAQDLEMRRLTLVATYTHNSVMLTDAAGKIVWTNPGFTRLTGYTQAEALGHTPGFLLQRPETNQEGARRFLEGLAAQREFTVVIQNYTKAGAEIWVSVQVHLVLDEDGRLVNYLGISSDITALKQNALALEVAKQRAEQANQAKSSFLANISHELRTPLNVILGNLHMLVKGRFGALNDRQQVSLSRVQENGAHLLSLINDLLDVTKSESGRITLQLGSVQVGALVDDCCEMLDGQAALKSIRLQKDCNHGTPVIEADPLRLKQILINLLSNALKFAPEQGVITLRTRETANPPELILTVSDTGEGVAPNDRDRIFEEFDQGSSAGGAKNVTGTGLGLTIARRLAEMHGGSLVLSSEPGNASEFIVRLPIRKPVRAVEILPLAESAPAKPKQPGDFLILAVEDFPANLEILASYLELEGYRVAQATSGEEALTLAASLQPNLILMDVRMPGIDGLEATRRLKADPRTAEIPVVSLTAFARLSDATRCFEAGAVGYLSKPVDFSALDAMLATHLRGQT